MLSEPRALSFVTELEWPPIEEMKVKKEQVRRLYNKLCGPGENAYENLDLQAETPTLSTRRPNGGESRCRLGGHRMAIEEKSPECDVEGFIDIVTTVLKNLEGELPPVLIHRVRIECLSQVGTAADSIDLLAGNVSNVLGAEAPFKRYPSFFGVRLRFVPGSASTEDEPTEGAQEGGPEGVQSKGQSDTPGEDGPDHAAATDDAYITLRLETYAKDIRQVWMEVSAQYIGPLDVRDNADAIETNIRDTYRFLSEKAKRFLDQFDTTNTAEEGDHEE